MSCAAKASTLGAWRCSVLLEPPAHRTGKTIENHEQIRDTSAAIEHFDVLIVGAGISGIGGAYHLSKQCPGMSFVVLDALEDYGGTWRTHRFPGIRSDSDLYTFGYAFKPWTGAPIATAAEILRYLGEVIDENDLGPHIRYRHRIASARWSSRENLWTLDATRTDTGETVRFTASFLWMCQGYYRHSRGYTPEWDGMEAFEGRIVHPQTWPEDLELHREASRRHRFWCHRSDAHSGDCRRLRPCHDAAALADVFQDGSQCDSDRGRAAGAGHRRDVDPRDRAQEDPVRAGRIHPSIVQPNRRS